jgi:tRNA 2-thiouridine synthesizing protein A
MVPGQVLHLITTDPGALRDVPAMARQRGDVLLETEEGPGRQSFLIERGVPA